MANVGCILMHRDTRCHPPIDASPLVVAALRRFYGMIAATARDRGREGVSLPALRTVRAVLPHTALQSMVSTS